MKPVSLSQLVVVLVIAMTAVTGCKNTKTTDKPKTKPPRPVEVATLRMEKPTGVVNTTASVASWKTEQIGFEVGGRIEWVAEPNTNIEGHVVDKDNNVVIAGSPIAKINDEKYRLAVKKAEAELSSSRQDVIAAEIELNKSLPAQTEAANADLELAKIELERYKRLVAKKAGAQGDVDKAAATLKEASSQIEQLKATEKGKEANLISLNLKVKIAQQAVEEANRDLNNCILYSSFRGQIAGVAVVPGSVVSSGNPVVTVQMMNPIKVEFEVSANESRRLKERQQVSVTVSMPDGSTEQRDGSLYLIDPVADPLTRTFTITVLVENQNLVASTPGSSASENAIPATDQTWPMILDFLPGSTKGMDFAVEGAIHEDIEGSYVWKVDNIQIGENPPADRLLTVSKLRIKKLSLKLPFLGNWLFQQIDVLDKSIDLEKTLIVGKLTVSTGDVNDWDGDTVRIEPERQWILRPGDLVTVDMSNSKITEGIFVPMNAIVYHDDKTYLMAVESLSAATVKRIEIKVLPHEEGQPTSSVRRIESADGNSLAGTQYVTKGAHYLQNGQSVRITGSNSPTSQAAANDGN